MHTIENAMGIEQFSTLFATFMLKVSHKDIDPLRAQEFIRCKEAGALFARFINQGVDYPFNPAEFVGDNWVIDLTGLFLTKAPFGIDLSKVSFMKTLHGKEEGISTKEHVARLQKAKAVCLGSNHFYYCWTHRDRLCEQWGIKGPQPRYIHFYADPLRRTDPENESKSELYCLWLLWDGTEWSWHHSFLDNKVTPEVETAVYMPG